MQYPFKDEKKEAPARDLLLKPTVLHDTAGIIEARMRGL